MTAVPALAAATAAVPSTTPNSHPTGALLAQDPSHPRPLVAVDSAAAIAEDRVDLNEVVVIGLRAEIVSRSRLARLIRPTHGVLLVLRVLLSLNVNARTSVLGLQAAEQPMPKKHGARVVGSRLVLPLTSPVAEDLADGVDLAEGLGASRDKGGRGKGGRNRVDRLIRAIRGGGDRVGRVRVLRARTRLHRLSVDAGL